MTFLTRAGVTVAGLATTAVLAGCGSSGGTLLSADAANQLKSELNQASTALADDNCLSAQNALSGFSDDVSQLTNVNVTLVRILNQSAATITALAEKRCPTGETTTTASTTTTTQSTTTTATVTTATVATTTTAAITTETNPDDGGTGFTTTSTPAVTTTPAPTPTTPPAPPSGGAGLGGTGNTGSGGGGGL
jgi:hypothetical protein